MKGPLKHNSNGYKEGCRCYICTDAHRVRLRKYRDHCSVRRLAGEMPERCHGLLGYITWGCRCQVCRKAMMSRKQVRVIKQQEENGRSLPRLTRRPVVGIHKETGAVVLLTSIYAAKHLDWNLNSIGKVARGGPRHKSAYGYIWRYEDPENPTTHWIDADGVQRVATILA